MDDVLLILGAVGGVSGFIALFFARGANKAAREANKVAKDANVKSDTANRIATDANEISSQSNAISKRALAVSEDETVYNWEFKLDYQARVVIAQNNCAHDAINVRVVVRIEDRTVSEGVFDRVPEFSECHLEGGLIVDHIHEDQRGIDRINAEGGIYFFATGKAVTSIYVTWFTVEGVPRSEVVEKTFSR